ncbi:MAG: hypothetical protein LBQ67_08055 [Treponema sp.]|jgi:hypothetical protein|nr:hypothetical protein [Treponema sp.]
MGRSFLLGLFLFIAFFPLLGHGQEVLRGEVWVELEPVYGAFVDEEYPLDMDTAAKRALEEAAMFFSAMIYGWSFNYDIGERARGIAEQFELEPVGAIAWGDPGLRVTAAGVKDMRLSLWADYRPRENQLRRLNAWKAGNIRGAQAVGCGPLGGPADINGWFSIKKTAMEDAARTAIRAMLRGSERNRPKEARGFISLAAFPRYFMDSGRWLCSARFRVEIKEIVPFSAY